MAIQVFLGILNRNFQELITGIEKVDMNESSTFMDYVKSKLFSMPTILLIRNVTYVSLLVVGLFFILSNPLLEQLIFWALISLLAQIPFTVYTFILMKKNIKVAIDITGILKYLSVCVGSFGITYYLTELFLEYTNNIFIFIPNVLLFVIIGLGLYLVITYFVDYRTRILFKAILKEIKSK